jgi:hypothetical protein
MLELLVEGGNENGDLLGDLVRGSRGLLTSGGGEKRDLLDGRSRGGMTFSIPTSDLDGDGGGGYL